jgi:predicted 3-demethylubiquinone-9 3-methyltransferase (glyoxalase superfamily)
MSVSEASDSPRVSAGRDRQLSGLARLAVVVGLPFLSMFVGVPLWCSLLLLLGLAVLVFVAPHLSRRSQPDPKQAWMRLMAGFVRLQSAYCDLQQSPANAVAREHFSVLEERCLSLLGSRADSDWGQDSQYAAKIRDEINAMSAQVSAQDGNPASKPGLGIDSPAARKQVPAPARKDAATRPDSPAPAAIPDIATSERLLDLILANESTVVRSCSPISSERPDTPDPVRKQDVVSLAGKRLTPYVWLPGDVEDAAAFYVSIFKNSLVASTSRYPEAAHAPTGGVRSATVCLDGQELILLNGGPAYKLPEAFSLLVRCVDQAEVDYYWQRLLSGGGEESMCGWLKDRFGVTWQVVPDALLELLNDPNPQRAARTTEAMLKMKKIDIAALREAVDLSPRATAPALSA